MTRDKLDDLAVRVEAAEGPDRELDRLIWLATDPNGYAIWEGWERGALNKAWDEERRQVTLKARARVAAKKFTASIDAALTLTDGDELEAVLCAAMLRCGQVLGKVTKRDFPRFIVSTALRTRAAQ